jgi:hypothetical protein
MVDVHSRFMLLKAIPDKRMQTIAALWLDIFTTFGFPKTIQSDNGSEFVNQTVKKMLEASKIEHRLITPYHPRANGLAERAVQTTITAIKKLLQGIKHNWDVYVPFVQYAVNQKISERHHHRPFEVIFARQANAFADFSETTVPAEFEPSSAEHEQVIKDIQQRIKTMQEELFPAVASKSRKTANKMAKAFDKRKRHMKIPEDTFVMVRNNNRKSKLDASNIGPYKVVSKNRGGAYVLQDSEGQILPHNYPPSALIPLSTNPLFEQDSHEVEAILNHQETSKGMQYLVRWKNFPPEADSWESVDNFDEMQVIQDYWARRGRPVITGFNSGGR